VKTPEANSAGGVDLHLSTVQELHVAAAIATQVRRGSHKQVNVYDRKTGETIKRVPIDDVLIGIAKVSDLTFSVRDDAPQTVCAGWDGKCPKGARPPKRAFELCRVVIRRGEPWRCRSCSTRRNQASMTPERRREARRKQTASMTPEQRSEIARKGVSARTPEQRSEIARKRNASRTPEQRSESARAATRTRNAAKTSEHRSEIVRKAWATRRANATKRNQEAA
jgi:general stress protein YciG